MDLGADKGTLGGATLWASDRRAVGGGHHADSDGRIVTVGDQAIPGEADIRLDDLDGYPPQGLQLSHSKFAA